MNHLSIIIFILGLALGILAIYITFFEQKLYKTKLTKFILYFIVYTNVATAINLFYNYFLINLIKNLKDEWIRFIELSYRLFACILLLFVFWVMISLFRSLCNDNFNKKYKLILFLIWIGMIIIFLLNLDSSFAVKRFSIPIPSLINVVMDYLGMLIVTFEIIRTILKSRKDLDQIKKKIVLKFSFAFLFIFMILLSMTPLSFFSMMSNDLRTFVSSLILLMFNILPLLYIKESLRIYYYDLRTEDISVNNINELVKLKKISETEAKIIKLICEGHTNKKISDILFLSIQTIKDHNYRIFKKMNVSNRVQLTKLFLQKNN